MTRTRLDRALERRGLLPSRARARDAVLRGTVSVNGALAHKPGQMVAETDILSLSDPAASYVSRAALKLIAGLEVADITVTGLVCLDVGASTGGFTQVLLERGAAKIYAIDVGHDQLAAPLRADPRIVCREGFNARDLSGADISEPVDLLVSDVSFVSVTKVLGPALELCAATAWAVILFKPQFEVGRTHVGRGGIVSDRDAIARARDAVIAFINARGFALFAALPSPIAGGDGNQETVLVFRASGVQIAS